MRNTFAVLKGVTLAVAVIVITGCARTTLYRNGEKIAVFQGDMRNTSYVMSAGGDVRWTADSVDHSKATLAQGTAAAGKLQSAGAAIAASGITMLLK